MLCEVMAGTKQQCEMWLFIAAYIHYTAVGTDGKKKPLLLREKLFAALHRFSDPGFCITCNFHCCMTISRRRAIHADTEMNKL